MRVAAIDLGTNSTRLLVADVLDGRLTEVARRLAITRLGESVDELHVLLPAAIARVRRALDGYRREAESLGAERVLAIATSAVRDAENGAAFLSELEGEFGLTTRLLSGDEEAELMLAGILSDRTLESETLIVDIGGGSTELVLAGHTAVVFRTSLQLGCVRLTERLLPSDPPTPVELEACAAQVRSVLPELEVTTAIGVAGTVTTAAALDLGAERYDPALVHGHRVSAQTIEREIASLASLPLAERERVPCLEPARAPVIVAGLVILREILAAFGLREIEASERDILHGAALAAAEPLPAF